MATPKKKKDGRWTMQIYIGTDESGKRIYKRITADTKAECIYKASVIKHEGIPEITEEMTVCDAVEQYVCSIESVISPNTLRGYQTILDHYFPELMDLPVSSLNNITVQTAINNETKRITKNGTTPSPKTISNGYGLIATALKKVCGRVFDVKLPQKIVKIKEFPDMTEIVAAIRGTSSELPCLLAAWLGMRMGEIKGLDCSSVRDGVLHIEQTRIYKDGKETVRPYAKNDTSIRNVNIPPYLMELINCTDTYRKYRESGENGPLIPTPRNRIYKRWKGICAEHGWEMTFHDLRAVNASVALILGVPDKYMMQRNGYKTDYTYKRTYQQTFSSSRQAADRMIDDYFEQLLGVEG